MRDEDFSLFIEEFGEPDRSEPVPDTAFERWADKLPAQLLNYWRQEGWCSYGQGLLWTVNPDDYEDLVDEWLADTPLEQVDAFHVFARSAFGDLYLCGEKSGSSATLCCSINAITAVPKELKPKDVARRDSSICSFFAASFIADYDRSDLSKKPLFKRACAKLGVLAADEMYGFEPALVLGGKPVLENLRKVKLDQHLTMLRQFGAPKLPFAKLDF
ncbi:GAD-like domain-containing protein [Roseateles sp. BYS78W]|uniref:GAD-like domain-containing protein n=1 Tax=Pelomonas candidula TaxID=3299025 RepID=A0ABW7HIP9_9BURK